jgi:hypothetical protein
MPDIPQLLFYLFIHHFYLWSKNILLINKQKYPGGLFVNIFAFECYIWKIYSEQ